MPQASRLDTTLGPGSILLLNPFQVHQEFSLGGSGWSFRYFFPEGPGLERILGEFAGPVVRNESLARALARLHASLLTATESSLPEAEGRFADCVTRLMKRRGGSGRSGESPPVVRIRDICTRRRPMLSDWMTWPGWEA